MKSIKFLTSENIDNLRSEYNLNSLKVIKYDENTIIIFIDIKTNKSLEKEWKNINNILSEDIDDFLETFFMRWNVYCIYIIEDDVTKELKYKVENNTFFARKIVEDNYTLDLSEENIKNLISSHISFDDLDIRGTTPTKEPYLSNSLVYKKLLNLDTLDENKIDDILKSLEKDDDEV